MSSAQADAVAAAEACAAAARAVDAHGAAPLTRQGRSATRFDGAGGKHWQPRAGGRAAPREAHPRLALDRLLLLGKAAGLDLAPLFKGSALLRLRRFVARRVTRA
jgi:hypothetical protein